MKISNVIFSASAGGGMNDCANRISIIITSRNRADDLRYTLNRLLELGLSRIPIIVIDDASSMPIIDPNVAMKFDCFVSIRNDYPVGLIRNRNRLATLAKTDYICSLDDDSCFTTAPDLAAAISYLDRNQHVVGLELNNLDVNISSSRRETLDLRPLQTYTGCGHILRKSDFIGLGGYYEPLMHMCEEREFTLKAWQNDLQIHSFYSIWIDHLRSSVARNVDRNTYFRVRNTIIFTFMYFPFDALLRFVIVGLLRDVTVEAWTWKRQLAVLNGWKDGLIHCFRARHIRKPLSHAKFKKFRQLSFV